MGERCEHALEHVTTLRTSAPGEAVGMVAQAVAEDRDLDLIVVVGGDGTLREAAEGLARGLGRWPQRGPGAGTPVLCPLPAGSGNSAYHELYGRRGWQEALDLVLAGGGGSRVRELDLVRVVDGDRASLLGVNAGLIAHLARHLERRKDEDRRRGASDDQGTADDEQRYWAAFGEAIETFEPFAVRVTVDGDVLYDGSAMMVTVGGVRSFGRGNFQLLPRSVLDDGLLDVCVVHEVDLDVLTQLATLVRTGEHLQRPEIDYAQGARVTLERTDGEALAIEHDGDPRPAGQRVELHVVRGAAPVVVPS